MRRLIVLAWGLIAYAFFFATFCYVIGFLENAPFLPKTIDSGVPGPLATAILINVACLATFAIQHTIMARPAFKRWWTTIIPEPMERSTFVLVTSAILAVTCWQWRPMIDIVWDVEAGWARAALYAISLGGFGIVLYSSFLIDHFDLFGLRQTILGFRGRPYTHHPFMQRSLYRVVRHPLMVGFLVAFWSAPTMTTGRLLFAAVTTGYILFGIMIEERDLVRFLGDDYRRYRASTPALVPGIKWRRPAVAPDAPPAPVSK